MTVLHESVSGWAEPTATARLDLLRRTRTIAMVGVSANASRPSNFVATYLLSSSADFEVYFVNPMVEEILGEPCYATLEDLPVERRFCPIRTLVRSSIVCSYYRTVIADFVPSEPS